MAIRLLTATEKALFLQFWQDGPHAVSDFSLSGQQLTDLQSLIGIGALVSIDMPNLAQTDGGDMVQFRTVLVPTDGGIATYNVS